ncbi:tRNA pseudouridine(38-40) synthase TruA [Aliidiomarina maris]|uniref:tRNA pseudouridine synthase A n=1 Tax=Aliidiomarina maris TaxID=531312 RepID=A0A327WXM3_9GAMM|nr:tRNA pseudouridine(38-40) synthase TruA [Aliidiomarina maris]RAJ96899.1 tRNA pseudouridine38-40 synthase [Aliidiomarina maris]RUO24163.1 tRNA pseudouridine(38-40) synthase TruA [Aliidiomarina maris]
MRIALGIEYNGAAYYGWQRQQSMPTVQGMLEKALSKIADHPVQVTCAGRTDAGVHATGQVVNFDTSTQRAEPAWTLGVNSNLPSDIAVRWSHVVDETFDARFSATARRYRYVIYDSPTRPAILASGVTHIYHPLDVERMQAAAPALLGEHDFSAFRAAHCQSNTPFRHIQFIEVTRRGRYIVVEVMANAFLHHMVRNIVGSLIVIGQGEQPTSWLAELLAGKDRTAAAATAKPNGLYLVDVTYPERFQLPRWHWGPVFW